MSRVLRPDERLAMAVAGAIRAGDIDELKRLLRDNQGLAAARIRDENSDGVSRTLLHVATDWPGHFPNVAVTIHALVAAGADAGANLEAPGAVIAGGTPLDDAVAFGQWRAARELVNHGARTALWHAAALGLIDRVEAHFTADPSPAPYPWGADGDATPDELTVAFWCACHGGQRQTAEYLLQRGADLNWIATWDGHTPLDTARREGADDVVAWLRTRGATTADELTGGGEER